MNASSETPAVRTDARQSVIIERALLAMAASAIAVGVVWVLVIGGSLPAAIAVHYTVLVGVIASAAFTVILSGANLRFADPSLAAPLLVAAGLATAYVLYHATSAQPAVLTIYLMAFMFATIAVRPLQIIAIALFYAGCYAAVIGLLFLRDPDPVTLKRELMRLALFAIVLGWFAAFGHYLSSLRGKLAKRTRQLKHALEQVEQIAIRDALTNLYNRRFLIDTLQRELARAARSGAPLSVCLLDIDHFKQINDSFGHAAGDAVLRRFAELAAPGLRGADVLGRYGGEEFMLVMPEAERQAASACAGRNRVVVAA